MYIYLHTYIHTPTYLYTHAHISMLIKFVYLIIFNFNYLSIDENFKLVSVYTSIIFLNLQFDSCIFQYRDNFTDLKFIKWILPAVPNQSYYHCIRYNIFWLKYAMTYIWIPFIVNLSSYLNDIIIMVSQFYTRLHTWNKGKVLEIFVLNELYRYIVGQT